MKKIQLDLKTETALAGIADELKVLDRTDGGKIRSVPEDLRQRIVKIYLSSGLPRSLVARRIGITTTTIRGWELGSAAQTKKRDGKFRRVRVVQESRSASDSAERSSGLILELPGGARVHGLDLEGLRALLKEGFTA